MLKYREIAVWARDHQQFSRDPTKFTHHDWTVSGMFDNFNAKGDIRFVVGQSKMWQSVKAPVDRMLDA